MYKWPRSSRVLAVYGSLISISAFIAALVMFQIPSDPENRAFLGLSFQRLALIGCVSLVGILAAEFSFRTYGDKEWLKRIWELIAGEELFSKAMLWGALAGLVLGWVAACIPFYRYGNFQDYFIRLHPLLIWFTFLSGVTFLLAWGARYGFYRPDIQTYKSVLNIAFILMTVFILIWILISSTGLGLRISEDYWYATGVPILPLQIVYALAIGGLFFLFEKSYFHVHVPKAAEILIFAIIWGAAAFLWAREPVLSSYFAPGPYLPDFQYHPYSDAATFDLASQFALIGQGINNGLFFDRALYMGFLVFLHALAGQDYSQVVALQAAIYAVFPAILYQLGKEMHSRTLGIILAVLATLRGLNGIAASSMIDLANQKQMLTDFPLAILMVWLALMLVKWLKSPNKNYHYALWVGGIAGLGIMIRTHALFSIVFAVLLSVIVYWRQKSRALLVSLFLVTAMFVSVLPWGVVSGGSVFDVFISRIRTVLAERYFKTPSQPTPDPIPQVEESESVSTQPVLTEVQLLPIPVSIATNFFHNLVTSVFILPVSPVFHDLRYILKEATPFWEQYWDGSMATGAVFIFILNLMLVALGVSLAWRSVKLPGLVPLGIFFFYQLANAMARTSGGRYIVPVDWVVFLYFALGLLQVMIWAAGSFGFLIDIEINTPESQTPWLWTSMKKAPAVLFLFLFIGATLPVSEMIFPLRYPPRSQAELLTDLENDGHLYEMGLTQVLLKEFSRQSPAFRVVDGRALYPRFYLENKGENKRRYPYQILAYPRIGFVVIGSNGINNVILPQDEVPYFPNASDVIVLGCQNGENMDALAVVVIAAQTKVYVREPVSPLQCPLQAPVCDGNGVCR